MTTEQIIASKPRFLRATPTRGAKPVVERDGGDNGAGLIRNAAIVTEGEALGHGVWLDRQFVEGVHEQVKATGTKGLKMRFTHPGLSSDGMGSFLGRGKNGVTRDGVTYADIHFAKSAHKTPDGDLASYVMDMAEEDPEAFGTSIVFEPDYGAEEKFISENKDKDGRYRSPDPNNSKNYPHARLAKLRAADVVDEPAANPNGLFRRGQDIADEAEKLCSFALGLTTVRPSLSHLSVDPDRTAAFVARFLDNHNLELKDKQMSAENTITKEDFEAAQAASEAKYAALEAKLTALTAAQEDAESPEAIEKRGALRASQIMAAAAMSGLSDHAKLASEAIENGLSLESFKASITDRLLATNRLTEDEGQQDPDPHAKFRSEFRADKETFAKFGVTDEDAYVRGRCDEEGLPVPVFTKAS
jgi:hypothetical protein